MVRPKITAILTMLLVVLAITAVSGCTTGSMNVSPTAAPTAAPTVPPAVEPTPAPTIPQTAVPQATPTPVPATTPAFIKGWGPYPTTGPWTPGDDTFVPTPTPAAWYVIPPWIDFRVRQNLDRPDAPAILRVTGLVDNPLGLNLYNLKGMPIRYVSATTTTKKGTITVNATGTLISALLDAASPQSGATRLVLRAGDGYSNTVLLSDVRGSPDAIVGFMSDGTLRAIIPGLPGNTWVSNLVEMEVQ
jgi:DMSO/TMAO reductase YedYZ molybdopterin-dependent catalytic subunit